MLLLKVALAPLLIAAVSLAGRRWGPAVAGWLLGLPLISGPVLFFLAIEQGPQFASTSARGSVLGLLAWAAFSLVYAYCAKLRWWQSTLIGWAAYFVVAVALLNVRLRIGWAFLFVCCVMGVVILAFPRTATLVPERAFGKYELWLRMISATLMVLLITAIATMVGATASGILTTFPTYTTILAVFNHLQDPSAAVHVLKGVTAGLYTAATFLMTLSLTLPRLHVGWCFLLALAAALPVQTASFVYLRRSNQHSVKISPLINADRN